MGTDLGDDPVEGSGGEGFGSDSEEEEERNLWKRRAGGRWREGVAM